MPTDKELNDFEANVVLRRAMALGKINIELDPNYPQLQEAEQELKWTMHGLGAGALSINAIILYTFWYKSGHKAVSVLGRMATVSCAFVFFYYTSPGYRNYSKALIKIAQTRKKDLYEILEI